MPNRRRFLSLAAAAASTVTALAAAGCALPAQAAGSVVDVQLVDRASRSTLRTWGYRGATWVAGKPGDRYAVKLTNRSGARVLVVLSVDGVNAVTGETASPAQGGYVLAPYETAEITGWRKNLNEAAAFYFTALPDSYAARTERPDNVGVIGAAVFRERVGARDEGRFDADRSAEPPRARESEASAQGAAKAAAPSAMPAPAPMQDAARRGEAQESRLAKREEKLGTGHGEREYSPIAQTTFERASDRPADIVKLRYDSYENLVASGVVQPRRPGVVPEPFPRFVPDPRG